MRLETNNLESQDVLRSEHIPSIPTIEDYLSEGLILTSFGHYGEALECYIKALKINPKCAEAYSMAGIIFSRLGDYDSAISYYDGALKIAPKSAETYFNKGIVLAITRSYKKAIGCFDKVTKLNPYHAEAYYNKGKALYVLGLKEEAIASYDMTVKINPNDAVAYAAKGNALYVLGRKEEAIAAYGEATRIKPDYAAVYSIKGLALSDLGRKKEAVEACEEAIRINPDYADAYYNKGNALSALGDKKGSIEAYEEVIRINPNYNASVYSNKGLALSTLGYKEEAIVAYGEAIIINPNDALAYGTKGNALSALGHYEEAIAAYVEAIRINPNIAEIYYSKGVALSALGRHEEAVVAYGEATRINPNIAEVYSNKGNALSALGRHEEAITAYKNNILKSESTNLEPKKDIFTSDMLSLLAIKEQNASVLASIGSAYKNGLEYYNDNNLELAEQEFVKVLRPVLSKPLMKAININDVDAESKVKLLDAMFHLGKIYLKNDEFPNHHSKAAGVFQYCARFAEEYGVNIKISEDITGDANYFIKQAYYIEKQFFAGIGRIYNHEKDFSEDDFVAYQQKMRGLKEELLQLRSATKVKLDDINKLDVLQIAQRAGEVQGTYDNSARFFVDHENDDQGFLQKLIKECIEQLGGKPEGCDYAVIGFGSLAGGKMTPWSDLEFAILINKEEYKEYFRNLTKLLNINIINLGETRLSGMGVESLNNNKTAQDEDVWFDDDITPKGISFDGALWWACKLPLGRQGYKAKETGKNKDDIEEETIVDKPDYELIRTPQRMAEFQKVSINGEHPNWFKSDKYLVQALRSVSLIYGNQDLLDTYRGEIRNSPHSGSNALELLKQDINKFALKLGDKEEGKLFNVKMDIYRLGDRVIDALADYYGIMAAEGRPYMTIWEKIDAMRKNGKLSKEGAQHLKNAIGIATELRLRTYYNNDGQDEMFSTYVPAVEHLSEEQKQELLKKTFHFNDTKILHHFYYIMLRIQNLLKDFCDNDSHEQAEMALHNDILFDDNNNHNKGLVCARFLEYASAFDYMRSAREEKPKDSTILNDLYFLSRKAGNQGLALDLLEKMLQLSENENSQIAEQQDKLSLFINYSGVYISRGEYDKAIEYHQKALNITHKYPMNSHVCLKIAGNYYNMGNACLEKGSFDQAIGYYQHALSIGAYFGKPNHNHTSTVFNGLGRAYYSKGDYEKAIYYFQCVLDMLLDIYKNSPNHPDIAKAYINIGDVYCAYGYYNKGINYFSYALDIMLKALPNSLSHPNVALIYNNLGVAYLHKKEYDMSINYNLLSLKIKTETYIDIPDHPDIAYSYVNLGAAYSCKGEYDNAIEYQNKALNIWRKVYSSNLNHSYIANSYCNLGDAYFCKGEYNLAADCADKAKIIYSMPLNQKKFLRAQTLYEDAIIQLGNLALLQDNLQEAEIYYKQVITRRHLNHDFLEFIQIQLEHINTTYNLNAIPAMINCQLLLLVTDPELKHGNHYHELACFYSAKGDIKLANEAFIKALTYPQAAGNLHAEYAQFLIINAVTLAVSLKEITKHLYIAVESNDNSSLQYGKIEQNSVCNILKDIIKEKKATITINPKALAYYLLLSYPEFITETDNIDNLVSSFRECCENLQDEIAFRLLTDACKSRGYDDLVKEYTEYLELTINIGLIVNSKGKAVSDNQQATVLNSEVVHNYVDKLQTASKVAIAQHRFIAAENIYQKLYLIYDSILTEELSQKNLILDNVTTIYLLGGNRKGFIELKIQGAQLNKELIKLAGEDVGKILEIQAQVYAQLQEHSQQPLLNELDGPEARGLTNEILKDDKKETVNLAGDIDSGNQ